MTAHVLVTHGEPAQLQRLTARLSAAGHVINEAADAGSVLIQLREDPIDVVVLDDELPGTKGFELLSEIISQPEAPSVLMLTRNADFATAVEAMRLGAENFLELPLVPDALEQAIDSALRNRIRPHASSTDTDQPLPAPAQLLGRSSGMRRVFGQIERIAASSKATALILGESGTGKELVANAIHERSDRAAAPFIAVNCAALTTEMLEAELFGYVAGSLAGVSNHDHDGLLHAAEGGTLFLDEIGELTVELQAKLLRVLEEGTYRRIGSTTDHKINVRILSSTHRDLEARVEDGSFREDLYYRLNVLSIQIPPLSQRAEDIPLLAAALLEEVTAGTNRKIEGFSESAMQRLIAHSWPGNVRELRNTVERSSLMVESGRIQPGHLGMTSLFVPETAELEEDLSLQAVEKAHIRRVIREAEGNRSQAARLLGVNRTTLYNKLRRYGISATS